MKFNMESEENKSKHKMNKQKGNATSTDLRDMTSRQKKKKSSVIF